MSHEADSEGLIRLFRKCYSAAYKQLQTNNSIARKRDFEIQCDEAKPLNIETLALLAIEHFCLTDDSCFNNDLRSLGVVLTFLTQATGTSHRIVVQAATDLKSLFDEGAVSRDDLLAWIGRYFERS